MNVVALEADFRVFQTHQVGWYDTGGYASLHPRLRATRSARAFDLSGRAAVIVCGGRGLQFFAGEGVDEAFGGDVDDLSVDMAGEAFNGVIGAECYIETVENLM